MLVDKASLFMKNFPFLMVFKQIQRIRQKKMLLCTELAASQHLG